MSVLGLSALFLNVVFTVLVFKFVVKGDLPFWVSAVGTADSVLYLFAGQIGGAVLAIAMAATTLGLAFWVHRRKQQPY
jgi:hypothetical protein